MRPLNTAITLLLFSCTLLAQPDRDQQFAAFAYLGGNFSQIDGDYYFGYNKAGLRFGIGAQLLLKPKYYLSVGLGYNQQGSRAARSERNNRGGAEIDLRLNTVEIPLLFHYRLGKKSEAGKKEGYKLYRSGEIQVGLAYSRLIGWGAGGRGSSLLPVKENFVSVGDQFQRSDLFLVVGASVQMGLRTALYIQHGKSTLGLYQPEEFMRNAVLPLYPYYLNLGVRYTVY